MSTERSEAILLRGVDYRDTSRILTALTPERGRIAVLAKGIRRRNHALTAVLDVPGRVELVYAWKDGRSVQTLTDAARLDGYRALKRDLEKGAHAAVLLEVALKTTGENEPAPDPYQTLAAGLATLADDAAPAVPVAAWVLHALLCAAGFAPELVVCVRTGEVLERAAGFAWEGGVVGPGEHADVRLDAELLAGLRALRAPRPPAELAGGGRVFNLLARYAAAQLDSELRSVRVLHDLFNNA